jgi:hypothetical protein
MTEQRRFTQRVRARMEKTGERYAKARGALLDELADAGAEETATHDDATAAPGSTTPNDHRPAEETATRHGGIATERVVAATGHDHETWFARLDEAGATTMGHPAIARHLVEDHGVDGWWAQHLTVAYEQARGLRAKHQRPDGFAISKSRTVVSLGHLKLPDTEAAEGAKAAWTDRLSRLADLLAEDR